MQQNSASPVGIFDSGIGGLTVAHSIKDILPNETEGIYECSYHHASEYIELPMEIFTYLSLNGIPYQTCKSGIIMSKKHIAILLLATEE